MLIDWLYSFLNSRSIRVKTDTTFSSSFCPSSGVPQGCVLSPLLFVLFVSDVHEILPSEGHLLYADDLKIYLTISTHSDCLRLQEFLNSFSLWCSYNQLSLCPEKCSVISFCHNRNPIHYEYSLSNSVLSRTSLIRDLGVLWDDKLSLNEHLESVVASASRTLGLICRLTRVTLLFFS